MKTFFFSFPRLNIKLTAPEIIAAHIETAFFHSITSHTNLSLRHQYVVEAASDGFVLLKDGQRAWRFGSCLDLICGLEEDIENTLTRAIGDWVGFHAGASIIGGAACVIPGDPDTGKTTTTFNLAEMGRIFLCEEVAPVDPETLLVHPFPQTLTLDRAYAETYLSLHPLQNGEFTLWDSRIARYRPYVAGSDPVLLKTILMPAYGPAETPGIEVLSPGEAFIELLGYCFPPNTDDERLFDSVLRICNEVEIFRLRTNGQQSMRKLLKELFLLG